MTRYRTNQSLLCLLGIAFVLLSPAVLLAVDSAATSSFSSTVGDTIRDHDFGVFKLGASGATYNFDVYNIAAPTGSTSDMTLSNVLPFGDSSALSLSGAVSALIAGGHAPMQLVLSTNQRGRLGVTYRLDFTSDSIQDSPVSSLVLTGHAIISPPGDYDSDGDVDSTDYTIWRSHFGATFAAADGNANGVVDSADFAVWRKNYTGPTGTGDSTGGLILSTDAAIPEPATLMLVVIGGAALLTKMRRRGHLWNLCPSDRNA